MKNLHILFISGVLFLSACSLQMSSTPDIPGTHQTGSTNTSGEIHTQTGVVPKGVEKQGEEVEKETEVSIEIPVGGSGNTDTGTVVDTSLQDMNELLDK